MPCSKTLLVNLVIHTDIKMIHPISKKNKTRNFKFFFDTFLKYRIRQLKSEI
jgi:hypothetical protein